MHTEGVLCCSDGKVQLDPTLQVQIAAWILSVVSMCQAQDAFGTGRASCDGSVLPVPRSYIWIFLGGNSSTRTGLCSCADHKLGLLGIAAGAEHIVGACRLGWKMNGMF